MIYREFTPGEPLRGLVHCIWILEHVPDPAPTAEKILPDGRAELIFNLGAPYVRVGPAEATTQPTGFVVGQIRRFLEVVPSGHVSLIGVRFHPTALHRLLGGSMSELTDSSVSLEELGRADLLRLEERLHETSGWEARVRTVEDHLLGCLPSGRGHIGQAVSLIRRTHGRLDLGEVARGVGISARTLDRRFGDEVGLTPKLFSRQIRFQRVFELLSREPRPSWAAISLASGCFDQAHLNREFRAFAGEPPAAFLRSRHELSDHLTGLARNGQPGTS